MTTNTDPVRALIEKWRGTHGSGFTSQGEFQAHLSALRTCADELEAAIASALPGAPSDDLPTLLDNLMRAAFDDGDRGREKFSGATMAARAAVLAHVRGASAPPSAPVGVDAVMVPKEPSEGVLVSMAIRYDHGLGVPGYYDQPLFCAENGGHKRRMESTVAKMRKLYEEVVGAGFYSREREEEYAALAQQPAAPSGKVVGVEQRARELLEAECGRPLPLDVPVCAAHSAVVAALIAAQQQGGAA